MDIPLIPESDVDGEERRGEDDAEGGDDGQRGEDGHADPRRLHSLDGPVSGRLFALRHPRDGRLVEEERVAGVLVLGDGHLVGPNDLLHRQPAAAFVILEFDSALQQPKQHNYLEAKSRTGRLAYRDAVKVDAAQSVQQELLPSRDAVNEIVSSAVRKKGKIVTAVAATHNYTRSTAHITVVAQLN